MFQKAINSNLQTIKWLINTQFTVSHFNLINSSLWSWECVILMASLLAYIVDVQCGGVWRTEGWPGVQGGRAEEVKVHYAEPAGRARQPSGQPHEGIYNVVWFRLPHYKSVLIFVRYSITTVWHHILLIADGLSINERWNIVLVKIKNMQRLTLATLFHILWGVVFRALKMFDLFRWTNNSIF